MDEASDSGAPEGAFESDDQTASLEPAAEPAPPPEPDYKARLAGTTQALRETRAELRRLRQAQRSAAPAPAGPAIPDPGDDPHGALAALREHVLQAEGERASRAEQAAQMQAHTQHLHSVARDFRDEETAFSAREPAYREAAEYLKQTRIEEYRLLGYAPQDAERQFLDEAAAIVDHLFQQGVNPAETVFALARQRGFAPRGGGALAAVSAGQAAARTLSAGGGRTTPAASPEARLANLNGAALREAWRKIKTGQG